MVLFPEEYQQLGGHVAKSSVFLLNFELVKEVGYFDVESHYKPLLHFWTLSVEEQYYLFWPIIIVFILKNNKNPIYFLMVVFIVSFLANVYFSQYYPQKTYFHTLTRVWQLVAGSLLAVWMINLQSGKKNINSYKGVITIVGIFFILCSALFFNPQLNYPGYWSLLPVLGAVMLIVANINLEHYAGLDKLGLISFPLYLWHWVLISFLYIYLGREPSSLLILISIIFSLFFAYLTYRYIERFRYKKSTLYLIILMVVVGALGAYIEFNKGLPERKSIENFVDRSIQFNRTSIKDKGCIDYTTKLLGGELMFDYCRTDSLEQQNLVVLIGDSKAHVLFPGVSELAKQHGYGTLLMANSSCPPLQGFQWGRNSQEVGLCTDKIEQILSVLQKDLRIKKVIIATRGPVYIHGEVEGLFSEESVTKSLARLNNENQTYEAYFNGFKNTMTRINKLEHVKEIYYFLENPELDFLPKEVFPRPFDYFKISLNRDYMDRGLYIKRMSVYRKNIFLQQKNFSKLKIIDPVDMLCDQDRCYSYLNGKSLYADDDHFSIFGSQFIANKIEGTLFKGDN